MFSNILRIKQCRYVYMSQEKHFLFNIKIKNLGVFGHTLYIDQWFRAEQGIISQSSSAF